MNLKDKVTYLTIMAFTLWVTVMILGISLSHQFDEIRILQTRIYQLEESHVRHQ